MAGVINSIQQVSITIAANATSGTATISTVTVANAVPLLQGQTNTDTGTATQAKDSARCELTNSTTVSAFRNTADVSNSIVVDMVVVEFSTGVNSIQAGTFTVTNCTSATCTITAVGANAFVAWLGTSATSTGVAAAADVVLTNSTTVTASLAQNGTVVVGYVVADLGASIISAIQAVQHTDATSATSYTDTITSVTPSNVLLIYGGALNVTSGNSYNQFFHTLQLTNATTVTLTRQGTNTASRTVAYTVVSFAATALNGSVQRGTIAEITQSSNTATITSVRRTKRSSPTWCGAR
jgi:hypothetical protein